MYWGIQKLKKIGWFILSDFLFIFADINQNVYYEEIDYSRAYSGVSELQ